MKQTIEIEVPEGKKVILKNNRKTKRASYT